MRRILFCLLSALFLCASGCGTLFFNRRLISEGDTELGLVVKNALDALDLPAFDPAAWSPRAVFERHAPTPVKELAARLSSSLPPLPAFMRAPQA